MKKLLLIALLCFVSQLNAFAKTGISFIYVNGSNINNSKISKWYSKSIQKFHPCMKNALEQNPSTQKYFLKCGEYFIEEKPITFYWGDKNYQQIINGNRGFSKGFTTWLAGKIRLTFSDIMHDVIWVQKHYNMNVILNDLQKIVKTEAKKGNKIVIFSYSSGNFITYEYLLTRMPYINVADFFNSVDISKEQRDFVSQYPMKDTCMTALEQNLGTFSADGHIILNSDLNYFKKSYMNLNQETDNICTPDNAVIGVVNLASPLVLFYSDLSEPNFSLTYYNRLLYKYILENDMFWLTVNYREDPFSFPSRKNLTADEIADITNLYIKHSTGFIYGQSSAKGGASAIMHLSYLSQSKTLSKAVVKAYVDGYRYQCDTKIKRKNKSLKKLNITP